jgi:hypothetical protein
VTNPNLANSGWIRFCPDGRFSAAIRRMRAWSSLEMAGRPPLARREHRLLGGAPPCERPASLYSRGPRSGPGYVAPVHQHLIGPIPPSQAHDNFVVRRLTCDAFAVRERRGDPRVVRRFTCSILPSMSSSTPPGSRSLHTSSSFTRRACLHREPSGSALPTLSDFNWRLLLGAFNGLVTLPIAGYDYGGN